MIYKIIFTLLTVIIFHNYGFSQHNHGAVEVEKDLHELIDTYDIYTKLLEKSNIILANDYENSNFKRFVKVKFAKIFRDTYHQLLDNQISLNQVVGIYDAKIISLINNNNINAEFAAYVANIPRIVNTPQPNSNDGERTPGNRTPGQPCTNLDFEDGTWSSWNVYNGDACDNYVGCITNVVPGTASNGGTPQHLITGAGMDPDVPISTLSPFGGGSSLRLGNLGASKFAEQIENEFLVTADKPYFSYEYAVVIENPAGHDSLQMPFFMVEFYDAALTQITGTCGNYYVDPTTQQAKTTFDSIQVGGQWTFYKDWARVTVDLTPFIGQNVTIRFTTSDCTFSGHLGRAYLDASCSDAKIDVLQDCQGIRLQAPMGYSKYLWSTGDTLDYIYASGPGQFGVDLISETGCTVSVDTLVSEVYVKIGHQVNFTEPVCNGDANGSITINAFGGTLPYQFSIDNGATWQASNVFNGLSAGNYDVVTQGSQGCGDTTLSINLTEPSAIVPNLVITDVVCFGACDGTGIVAPLGGTSPNGIYRVEWNGQNSNSNSISNLCPSNYSVVVIDEQGCAVNQNFPISEPAQITINQIIVDDEICYNNCDGKITINDPNAVEFSVDNGFTYSPNNIFNNLCAQAAPYTVAIKDLNGCIATQVVGMNQPPPLQINISPDTTICLNGIATIDANVIGGTNPINYVWGNGKNTQIILESPASYAIYSVLATDANGCWIADQMEVNLYPQPKADFEFSPGPGTDVFHPLIDFTNTSQSVGTLTYEWYFDALGTSILKDDSYDFPSIGGTYYNNCLKVENIHGCRDSICKQLYINYETLVYVPNTFTPDGDGVNDIFTPSVEGLNPDKYTFYIFNEDGKTIFVSDKTTSGWDGTYNNKMSPDGVYVWRIVSRNSFDESPFEKIGHITLLR